MKLQLSILLMCVALALTAFAKTNDEERQKRLVKRGLLDDLKDALGNAFSSFGDSFTDALNNMKDFSAEKFQDFQESLSSLTGEQKDNALNELKEYYNKLTDKTSAEALRVKESIEGLGGQVDGSTCLRSSLLGVAVLGLLCKLLF